MIKENFVPKYQKIIDDLRENVRSGVLAPGERLPVREELMQQYGVTRATVNRAMAELLREGLLVATPRAGTYVAERNTGDEVAVVVHSTLVISAPMTAPRLTRSGIRGISREMKISTSVGG